MARGQSFSDGFGHRHLPGPVFVIGVVLRNQTFAPKNLFHIFLSR
jgi:hypothetical protein